MRSIAKLLLAASVAAAMPVLAAVTLGGNLTKSEPDDDFSLSRTFIGSDAGPGFAAQSCTDGCTDYINGSRWTPGGYTWDGGGAGGGYNSGDYGGASETPARLFGNINRDERRRF